MKKLGLVALVACCGALFSACGGGGDTVVVAPVYYEDCLFVGDEDFDGFWDCADADCWGSFACTCGDGLVNHPAEECDMFDLGGAIDCIDLGYDVGLLGCFSDCSYDTTDCYFLVCDIFGCVETKSVNQ